MREPNKGPTGATWQELEREALTCPVLHKMFTIARVTGDRDAAVRAALLWFSRDRARVLKLEVERRSREI